MSVETAKSKVDKFFANHVLKRYDKGQMLIYLDEDPPVVFYIVKGHVRQYDITDTGEEVVVNIFKPGAFFPMTWAINHEPNQYLFEALTPVEVRLAPADEVAEFVRKNGDVAYDLLSRVLIGAAGMQRRMAHLMGGNSRTRVLYELSLECKRFGEPQPDGSCILPIHENELANRAGLTRETVSRELSRLRKQGLVETSHKNIIVKNLEQLEGRLGSSL